MCLQFKEVREMFVILETAFCQTWCMHKINEIFHHHSLVSFSSFSVAPMVNQCRGHRQSAAVHVGTTCGSVCHSTSRRKRTIRLLLLSLSPKPLRNITAVGLTCHHMSLCPHSRPWPLSPLILTMSPTRPCMSSQKQRSATRSHTGHRRLHRSAQSARE